MILTRKNFESVEIQNYCIQFCQILKALNKINVYLTGSIIRNWVALCYYYKFDPCNPNSFRELLQFKERIILHMEIDVYTVTSSWIDWIRGIDKYSVTFRDLVNILTCDNFCVEVSSVHKDNLFCKNVQLRCVPLIGMKKCYVVRIFRNPKRNRGFLEFDVDSLMAKGGEEDRFILVHQNWPMKTSNCCSFSRTPRESEILELLEKCIRKEATIINTHAPLTKRKIIESYEQILTDEFRITNSPVLSFTSGLCENKDTCSICQADEDSVLVLTKCNHLFHMKCIFEWWNTDTLDIMVNCPNCRSTFSLVFNPV